MSGSQPEVAAESLQSISTQPARRVPECRRGMTATAMTRPQEAMSHATVH